MKINPFSSDYKTTKQMLKLILGGGITWAGYKAFESLWAALSIPYKWRIPLYFVIFCVLIVAYTKRGKLARLIGRTRELVKQKMAR